eukprot:2116608-Pyramimonas_sp.AAC.1
MVQEDEETEEDDKPACCGRREHDDDGAFGTKTTGRRGYVSRSKWMRRGTQTIEGQHESDIRGWEEGRY